MSVFVPPMRRVDGMSRGRPTHWYVDGTGKRIPGVTTILNEGVPKPALTRWAANTAAGFAVDRWAELTDLPVTERLEQIKGAPWAERDERGNRGTEVHRLAERLIHGEEVEIPDLLEGHVESYVKYLDEWHPRPILIEVPIVNYTLGYAGTLDSIVSMAGQVWLIDIKTSKGVYGETALQVAAYAKAEFYVDAEGIERPMPHIDRLACCHVRADGYDLLDLPAAEDVLLDFRYAAAMRQSLAAMKSYVGPPLRPPTQEVLA